MKKNFTIITLIMTFIVFQLQGQIFVNDVRNLSEGIYYLYVSDGTRIKTKAF